MLYKFKLSLTRDLRPLGKEGLEDEDDGYSRFSQDLCWMFQPQLHS